MSAKQLIQIAHDKGVNIGKNGKGEYYYGYSNGKQYFHFSFFGTWSQFVKFIRDEFAPQPNSKIFNEIANAN